MDVCPACSPGGEAPIIIPEPALASSEPLELQRRKELNKMKKKYGLRVRRWGGWGAYVWGQSPSLLV